MEERGQATVLILTAGFGEGHNSASKALGMALEGDMNVVVSDPCAVGMPRLNAFAKWGYHLCITRLPYIWRLLFKLMNISDMRKGSMRIFKGIRKALEFEIEGLQPDIIVSTYPLYPYFLDKYFRRIGKRVPYYVVITDSLIINNSWLRVEPDAWLVTDEGTKKAVVTFGLPEDKVMVTGFPISPRIQALPPLPDTAWKPGEPPRVLYFANGSRSTTRENLEALLEAFPDLYITVVLGRNVRRLYRIVEEVTKPYSERVHVMGWTKRVPELITSHHLVVGKAGGATVHEALAARCPMLINHVVYGQEQGNAMLLENLGGGKVTVGKKAMMEVVREIFDHDHPRWPTMKKALDEANMDGGTRIIRELVLQKAGKNFT